VLVLQAFWVCEITYPGWKDIPGSICVLPKAVPITQMISKLLCPLLSLFLASNQFPATIISDGILVSAPLMVREFPTPHGCSTPHTQSQIIKGVRIPALRSRLLRIFSVSIVTTMASVTHAVLVMDRPGVMEAIFGTRIVSVLSLHDIKFRKLSFTTRTVSFLLQ
jgi:hypothetical protein